MKPVQSSIKRFILRLSLALLLILGINILLLGVYVYNQYKSTSTHLPLLSLLGQLSNELVVKKNKYVLNGNLRDQLDKQNMWAMLLDDRKGNILWGYRVPQEVPTEYKLSDIAALSHYYLKDYPVSIQKHPDGLIVLGSPKKSLWKIPYIVVPYAEIKALPGRIILILICNLLVLLLLYIYIDRKTMKAVSNVLEGIQSLSNGKPFQLKANGTFSEIAIQLNKTSDLLKTQSIAQENWIAGVSHDIRTPLSIILGYAENIETSPLLAKDIQNKASIIKVQGLRLRDLVNDLNLVTRLSDGTHTKHVDVFKPTAFCRELVASILNYGLSENYTIDLDMDKAIELTELKGDEHLLQRAINNLLHNSIRHNPAGCAIHIRLEVKDKEVFFIISDNGNGMTTAQIGILQQRSHYLSNIDMLVTGQHGFGLYIVQQIVKMHGGKVLFSKGKSGGLQVVVALPLNLPSKI